MRDRTSVSDQPRLNLLNCYWHEKKVKESYLRSALRIWQWWLTKLRVNNALQIWQTLDPWGNTWWHAYNPATGCSATRESETEILAWIERRVTYNDQNW